MKKLNGKVRSRANKVAGRVIAAAVPEWVEMCTSGVISQTRIRRVLDAARDAAASGRDVAAAVRAAIARVRGG